MRAPLLASMAAAAALVLSACGSATVDNSTTTASPETTLQSAAPSEAPSAAPSAESGDSTEEPAAAPAAPQGSSGGDSAAAQDRGAREIDKVPDAPAREESEQALLDKLKEGGIEPAGVEDQLVTAARAACNKEDQVTVQAIAGQLIEQGKTDLAIGDVITLIEDTARTGYCQP